MIDKNDMSHKTKYVFKCKVLTSIVIDFGKPRFYYLQTHDGIGKRIVLNKYSYNTIID